MRLRSLNFQSLSVDNLTHALLLDGFKTTCTGDKALVTRWLNSSQLLDAASTALSSTKIQDLPSLPAGYLWDQLPESHWEESCEVTRQFEWQDRADSDIREAVQFARGVLRGDDVLGDVLGDPVLFVAAIQWNQDSLGVRVAALLSAYSVLRTVVRCGGEFVWDRYAFDGSFPRQRLNVIWRDGAYVLTTNAEQRKASWRTKSPRGKARVLLTAPGYAESQSVNLESGRNGFERTADVAEVAMWLGVTVREVRIHVLHELLELEELDNFARYGQVEGVELADIVAIGGKTAIHSVEGKVVLFKNRILVFPSMKEASAQGYVYMSNWGLTRKEQCSTGYKLTHSYVRCSYEKGIWDWKAFLNSETYLSRSTVTNKLVSLCQMVGFRLLTHVSKQNHALVNAEDARARLLTKGSYVETREATTAKPQVSKIMLSALSDRIPINLSEDAIEASWERVFGANERPSAKDIETDEQVLVLSYRHESENVRMTPENWCRCYDDLAQVSAAHGKGAMRVWTDKLASNTRGDALWLESGVEPYRNAVVVAFNGPGDSIFVDRFWLSLERNTGLRAWGYWLRDDFGQLVRLGNREYPARTEDRLFLSQILFTPGRADGPLWEEDRLAVIREAAEGLGVKDLMSLWDALTYDFLPRRYAPFDVVDQERKAGQRKVREVGWSSAADVLLDRELVEKALGFAVLDRLKFEMKKWIHHDEDGSRFVAVKSAVSEDWFCARVAVSEVDEALHVEDVYERLVLPTEELDEFVQGLQVCRKEFIR